jgi:hypothetical protein
MLQLPLTSYASTVVKKPLLFVHIFVSYKLQMEKCDGTNNSMFSTYIPTKQNYLKHIFCAKF